MEQRIKDRYNESILQEAVQRYGISQDQISLLDGFESYIYEFERDSAEYILRIAHSIRRSSALIKGEIDWINYLSDGGVSIARVIPSLNGELVEIIDDGNGGQFLATAFTKALGGVPWEQATWDTPEFYESCGQIIGKMHALAKEYQPSDPDWKRPEWDAPGNLELDDWLPESESDALGKFRKLKPYLDTLPKDREGYGLIHQDAHAGNFFMDESGKITLFDFDDCVYGWYIYDISMVLFYKAMGPQNTREYVQEFMTNFLRGYGRENQLDAKWLKEIPYFLKLREIDLYAVIHRSYNVDNLVNEDPWAARYMEGRKERIEGDVPVIDFDFETLGKLQT